MNILITGSSSGIGFLTGIVLADRGHNVYMTTHTLKEERVLKDKIKYLDLDVNVFKLDVTNKEDRKLINDINLDCLFLHAGVGYVGLFKNMDVDLIRNNFEVNVFSNMELINMFLEKNKYLNKKVVMTSSLFSEHACPYFGSYILAKSTINLMMKIYRNENLFSNNKFIIIKPGAYYTGFNQYLLLTGQKNSVSDNVLELLRKMFYMIEEKELNSIVEKIVYVVERGDSFKYCCPLWQKILFDK